MTPLRLPGLLALLLALAPIAGCSALSSLDSAARSLDTYELSVPPAPAGSVATGRRVMQVSMPTASGGIGTDRIMIRPGALQIAYLSDGRWVDPVPVHVQQLLIRSLAGRGRLGFVGGESSGPLPDYVLLTDIQAFQAEVTPGGAAPVRVDVRMTLTLLRDIDRSVIAAHRFERSVGAGSDDAATVVAAFDVAMRSLLAEATGWILASTGVGS
jgi:cholesterol transport system auxiliary component